MEYQLTSWYKSVPIEIERMAINAVIPATDKATNSVLHAILRLFNKRNRVTQGGLLKMAGICGINTQGAMISCKM